MPAWLTVKPALYACAALSAALALCGTALIIERSLHKAALAALETANNNLRACEGSLANARARITMDDNISRLPDDDLDNRLRAWQRRD